MDHDATWYVDIVLDGDPARRLKGDSPQFSAHFRCGRMAVWIKMSLGMEVGLMDLMDPSHYGHQRLATFEIKHTVHTEKV